MEDQMSQTTYQQYRGVTIRNLGNHYNDFVAEFGFNVVWDAEDVVKTAIDQYRVQHPEGQDFCPCRSDNVPDKPLVMGYITPEIQARIRESLINRTRHAFEVKVFEIEEDAGFEVEDEDFPTREAAEAYARQEADGGHDAVLYVDGVAAA